MNRLRFLPHTTVIDSSAVQPSSPELVFYFIYGTFHSPTYRTRYAEFLKIDFPRVPLPGSRALFDALAAKGGELVALHLMESPALDATITEYLGPANPIVEKVSYSNNTVWIDKAQSIGFRGVPPAVWEFHIGGYQVCDKWLKDRKGRALSADDLRHYQRVVVALNETRRLMAEIDAIITQHGGFPNAFAAAPPPPLPLGEGRGEGGEGNAATEQATLFDVTGSAEQAGLFANDEAPATERKPRSRSTRSAPAGKEKTQGDDDDEPAPRPIDDYSKDELMAAIREACAGEEPMLRDDLIRHIAYALGYQRAGSRIVDVLDDAVRTAVKRGVLEYEGDLLKLTRGNLDTWDRDVLKREFLASLGRGWVARDDAIRGFARWLGYQRTGSTIEDTARSLMRGLLMEGRLEADGDAIRRT